MGTFPFHSDLLPFSPHRISCSGLFYLGTASFILKLFGHLASGYSTLVFLSYPWFQLLIFALSLSIFYELIYYRSSPFPLPSLLGSVPPSTMFLFPFLATSILGAFVPLSMHCYVFFFDGCFQAYSYFVLSCLSSLYPPFYRVVPPLLAVSSPRFRRWLHLTDFPYTLSFWPFLALPLPDLLALQPRFPWH